MDPRHCARHGTYVDFEPDGRVVCRGGGVLYSGFGICGWYGWYGRVPDLTICTIPTPIPYSHSALAILTHTPIPAPYASWKVRVEGSRKVRGRITSVLIRVLTCSVRWSYAQSVSQRRYAFVQVQVQVYSTPYHIINKYIYAHSATTRRRSRNHAWKVRSWKVRGWKVRGSFVESSWKVLDPYPHTLQADHSRQPDPCTHTFWPCPYHTIPTT